MTTTAERTKLHRLKCEALTSYWAFLDLIKFKGGTEKFGKCHLDLCAFVQENKLTPRRLVLMPRGHLKSTLCSVGYVLWRIYLNPDIRIIVGTATKPLATSFVREVKQYLEDAELQRDVWNARLHISGNLIPKLEGQSATKSRSKRNRGDDENFDEEFTEAEDKKVVWKADALQVIRRKIMKEPTLVASSVGSPATGFHFDLAIFDDLVSFDNSDTPEKCDKIINWVGDVESVVDPYNPETGLGGEFVMLGTRYYYRDLYGIYTGEDLSDDEKEEKDDFEHDSDEYALHKRNIYVNGVDDSDGYLWGERFNAQVMERIKKRMLKLPNGIRRYASQYLNSIMTDEEVVLNAENIQYIHSASVKVNEDGTVEINTNKAFAPIRVKLFAVIDPAISQNKKADNTVIAIGGVDEDKNVYIFDMKVGKYLPQQCVELTYELLDKWHINAVSIDNEKLGQALIHTFKQNFSKYRPLALREYKAEGEKKARISTFLEPLFTNNKIYLMNWMANLSQLQEEIEFFPRQGAHDDTLDAIAMLVHIAIPTRKKASGRKRRTGRTNINRRYGGVR